MQNKTDFTKNVLAGIGGVAILTMLVLAIGGFTGGDQTALSLYGSGDATVGDSDLFDYRTGGLCTESSGPIDGTKEAGNITFDENGNLWFAEPDATNKSVSDISYVDPSGQKHTVNLNLKIADFIVVQDSLYIADSADNKLKKYTTAGVLQWSKTIPAGNKGLNVNLTYNEQYGFIYSTSVFASGEKVYWYTLTSGAIFGKDLGNYQTNINFTGSSSLASSQNHVFVSTNIGVNGFVSEAGGKKSIKYFNFGSGVVGDVEVYNGQVYVDDYDGVKVYTLDGVYVKTIKSIKGATEIVFDPDGILYYKTIDGVHKFISSCATLSVIKDVLPEMDPNSFDFRLVGTNNQSSTILKEFTLDDFRVEFGDRYKNIEVTHLLPGDYNITELLKVGQEDFFVVRYECTSDSSSTKQNNTGVSVDVTLKPGEAVECTFFNIKSK